MTPREFENEVISLIEENKGSIKPIEALESLASVTSFVVYCSAEKVEDARKVVDVFSSKVKSLLVSAYEKEEKSL